MTTRAGAIIAIVGLVAAATAQTPSFVYSLQVANPNLNPGQTTIVTVLCGFSPAVGQPVTTPTGTAPVIGLFRGGFDLLGTAGVWSRISLVAPFNFIGTTPGTIAGANVTGVRWGTSFGTLHPPATVSPAALWSATFGAPTNPGPVTLTIGPVGDHAVLAGNPGEFPVIVSSQLTTGAQTVINVIPTPASLTLLGAGLVAALRRRRSGP